MQADVCSKLEEALLRLFLLFFFFLPEQDKWGDNPKTWCCRPLLSLTQTQRVGAHTHTYRNRHTHRQQQQGCHTGSQRKSGDDLQLWSPVARRAGLWAWPRFPPRTASAARRQSRWCHSAQRTTDFSQPTELLTLCWLLTESDRFVSTVVQRHNKEVMCQRAPRLPGAHVCLRGTVMSGWNPRRSPAPSLKIETHEMFAQPLRTETHLLGGNVYICWPLMCSHF